MSIGIAILGLALLVLIHEAGHFFVARAVGMRPRRFYVGFPPALAKVRRKGIEYGIGAIPLGGYVKIPGMHRPAPSDVDVHFGRALGEAPELAGPAQRLQRALAAGDFDHATAEVDALGGVVSQAELSPAARRSVERGLRDIGDALGADAYWRQSTWRKVAVIVAGPAANVLVTVALLATLFAVGIPTRAERVVEDVLPETPAARVGLQPGDQIVGINGAAVSAQEISTVVRNSRGNPLYVIVVRPDGSVKTLGPVRAEEIEGAYRLGFALAARYEQHGPAESLERATVETGRWTKAIGLALADVVTGRDPQAVSTPVGVVQGSSRALEAGFRHYLQVLALISLSLALLNLLPLLPLDGGHIAFSIVEALRGKAIPRSAYERVSVIGIALVLMLFFIGLTNDVNRLNGG
jgi:regulator of sigma E protease